MSAMDDSLLVSKPCEGPSKLTSDGKERLTPSTPCGEDGPSRCGNPNKGELVTSGMVNGEGDKTVNRNINQQTA